MAGAKCAALPHLTPAACEIAMLPSDERIKRIRADRWIGYPRAVEALEKLDELLNWPSKQRMPNLLIVGPTNNGKSMIIEKFRRERAPQPSFDIARDQYPIVAVQMPPEPTVNRFYSMVLGNIGTPLRPRMRMPVPLVTAQSPAT